MVDPRRRRRAPSSDYYYSRSPSYSSAPSDYTCDERRRDHQPERRRDERPEPSRSRVVDDDRADHRSSRRHAEPSRHHHHHHGVRTAEPRLRDLLRSGLGRLVQPPSNKPVPVVIVDQRRPIEVRPAREWRDRRAVSPRSHSSSSARSSGVTVDLTRDPLPSGPVPAPPTSDPPAQVAPGIGRARLHKARPQQVGPPPPPRPARGFWDASKAPVRRRSLTQRAVDEVRLIKGTLREPSRPVRPLPLPKRKKK